MMESFTIYLFKSAMWLSGFALIFFLFLRNEKFFILKRYYLLMGLVASILFPFISVKYQVEIPAPAFFVPTEYVEYSQIEPVEIKQFNYKHLLLFFYCAGVIFLVIKLMTQFNSIYKIVRRSTIERLGSAKLVCTDKVRSPFSFFNYIFIKPSIIGKEKEMIMNHELVHVNHKHWIDLVLSELVRLMQWINPVVWVYASFIRQNNEYIADEITLKHGSDPAIYKATILNQLFDSPMISLSNSFSFSLNKKRFEMMKTTIISPYRKARIVFVLPVIAILMLAFAEKTYIYSGQNDGSVTGTAARDIFDNKIKGAVYDSKGNVIPGAMVLITGTTSGTVTDGKGNFMLAGVSAEDSITVAFHGYRSRTIHVGNNKEFAIALIGEDEKILRPPPPPPDRDNSEKILPPPPPPPDVLNRLEEKPTHVFSDGVSVQYSEIEKIDPKDIISMRGLSGDRAVERNGTEAKDGVIEIFTSRTSVPQSAPQSDQEPKPSSAPASKHYLIPSSMLAPEADLSIPGASSKPAPLSSLSIRNASSSRQTVIGGTEILSETGKTPLYIIDGETYKYPGHPFLDPGSIESVSVLKSDSAIKAYGEKNKDGVVIIQTKESFRTSSAPSVIFSTDNKPLYFVDGKITTDITDLDLNDIKSINVLKNQTATEIYGEEAKNGVIIIETRKE
jgi:TonB-dependent SusC/RagA subfamily outer membrane receptor